MPTRHRRKLKRYDEPGHVRFLTFSCFQRRPFLRADLACQWLADAIERARATHGFSLWAYVFMPEHAHTLILPAFDRPRVGPILNSIKQSVAKRAVRWTRANAPDKLHLMADRDRKGRVTYRFWQRGAGYDRNLWTPRHIWEAIDYIHLNPVEAGLCSLPEQWHWSSAIDFEGGGAGPIGLDLEHLPARPA
jgi:REP-associated tyrosine transposase